MTGPHDQRARWVMFGAVGMLGWCVQLAVLWLLIAIAGVHHLVATALAVEAAIVHNFAWHLRWTWADRRGGPTVVLEKLVRFHLTNGVVSLAGNTVLMAALVNLGNVHYVAANAISVVMCSAANFVLSDRVVFATVLSLSLVVSAGVADARAADLDPAANQAFERYARLTELRMDAEREGKTPLLWLDRQPEGQRQSSYARLRRREIVISKVQTKDGSAVIRFPNALCHHWVGTVLIEGVGLARAVGLMQSYDKYPDIYTPEIRKSRVISRRDNQFTVYLQLFMRKVVTVVMNSNLVVDYLPVSASRMQVRSYSTKVVEVAKADTPDEHEERPGHDGGYLWRFNNYCALEERSEGTYVQCESISLSRDIPFGLGWLIGPFVNDVPKESLEFTLTAMRKALRP